MSGAASGLIAEAVLLRLALSASFLAMSLLSESFCFSYLARASVNGFRPAYYP